MREISFKSISCPWPIPPVVRLPGLVLTRVTLPCWAVFPLTVQENTSRFSLSVAESWHHHCVHVWCLGMLQGWLLEVFLFIFSSPSPLIIGWISLHVWRLAKGSSFGEEKWITWARPSAGINHACSVEATGDIPATSQRKQPCVLCDFLF